MIVCVVLPIIGEVHFIDVVMSSSVIGRLSQRLDHAVDGDKRGRTAEERLVHHRRIAAHRAVLDIDPGFHPAVVESTEPVHIRLIQLLGQILGCVGTGDRPDLRDPYLEPKGVLDFTWFTLSCLDVPGGLQSNISGSTITSVYLDHLIQRGVNNRRRFTARRPCHHPEHTQEISPPHLHSFLFLAPMLNNI